MGLLVSFGLGLGSSALAADAPVPHGAGSGEEEGEHIHGIHTECPVPRTPMDTLRCAQDNHPAVRRAKLGQQRAGTLADVARQIPNPELETQAVFGKVSGEASMQTQISLTQPIEWGGKRAARGRLAEAQQGQSEADLRQVQADVVLQTVRNLYRIGQIDREKELLEESIRTFSKLVGQHRARPRLAPEQEVSLTVFQMAESDSRLKMSALVEEEREIGHFFHISTGQGLDEVRKALPSVPKAWPKARKLGGGEGLVSPSVYRLMTDRDLAIAELESARAESWPGLRLGPMVQLQREGPLQGAMFGFQLNLDLPVFSLNGSGRAHAVRGSEVAESSIQLQKAEESHERAEQVRLYRGALAALDSVNTLEELERRHRRIEELIVRGLVSSSLAIEAHRQRVDLERSRNERELKAVVALWTIHKLDGRILQESL